MRDVRYYNSLWLNFLILFIKDIRNLIEEWAEDIGDSERIWIRASGANRKIFMDYDGAVITKGDGRLRTFPFPTRRPVSTLFFPLVVWS